MFKKVPYGVKVRVKGSEKTGYVPQYAICCNRFLPFLDTWTSLYIVEKGVTKACFDTLSEAQEIALARYDEWIAYYKRKEEEDKQRRKVSRKTAWKHP